MRINSKAWAGLIVALLFLIASFVLRGFIVQNPEMAKNMARGIASPMTWPRIMLSGTALFAFGWFVQGIVHLVRSARHKATHGSDVEDIAIEFGDVGFEHHAIPLPPRPVVLGIVLALAYTFAIPWLGFPIATVIFMVLWFAIGGFRNPVKVSMVTLIGTVILLYVFVKLALMPLDRGVGVLDHFTIGLFRLLGIY
jgi:putative tricarboxylic transport membrane protein